MTPYYADDLVTVDWGGRSSDCPIGHGETNGLGGVRCEPPKDFSLAGNSLTIKVTYRRGADGKTAFIGTRTVAVLSRRDEFVPGTIAHVVRPGYGPDDRVLRPAAVVVATRGE